MFYLSVLQDEVRLPPSTLAKTSIKKSVLAILEQKLISRIIPHLGVCVAVYDLLRIHDGFVQPGDLKDTRGEVICTVCFRVIIFGLKFGQFLPCKLLRESVNGLQVSVGDFFVDIDIPGQPASYIGSKNSISLNLRDGQQRYNRDSAFLLMIRVSSVSYTQNSHFQPMLVVAEAHDGL